MHETYKHKNRSNGFTDLSKLIEGNFMFLFYCWVTFNSLLVLDQLIDCQVMSNHTDSEIELMIKNLEIKESQTKHLQRQSYKSDHYLHPIQ